MIVNYKIIFLLGLLSVFCSGLVLCQNSYKISSPVLEYKDKNLHIIYNLPASSSGLYTVSIEIVNSKGEKIDAFSLSGDIGPGISSGNHKQIIWNIEKDSIFLNEPIKVRILAQQIAKNYTRANLIFKSTLLPGFGQTKISNGKPFWLTGIVAYGCFAGSYWYNRQSIQSYDFYSAAETRTDNDRYFDLAIQQDQISEILTYTAIGIWAVNIIWVAVMPNRRDQYVSQNRVNFRIRPQSTLNCQTVSLCLSINLAQ